MSSVLVTGGAGYIGSHTVIELINAGFDVCVVDNFSNSSRELFSNVEKICGHDIKLIQADVCDLKSLDKIFASHSFDSVIHFAGFKAVGESVNKPNKYYSNNLGSTIALLEIMNRHSVKKLVFSSSATVYGAADKMPITEESAIIPAQSPYGATKQICERIIQDASKAYGLLAVALRYFNPVGAHPSGLIGELPKGTPNNLVPFLTQAAAGLREPLTVFGNNYPTPDGTCIRDYIHVVDLAEAHVAAINYLQKPKSSWTAINIGTGRGYSVLELINCFEEATGQKVPFAIGQPRPGDVSEVWADVSLAKKLLGWRASKTLSESMRDSWNWQQNAKRFMWFRGRWLG